MLFLVEPARIKAVPHTKEREPNIWQEPLRSLADREGQQLDDGRAKGYARLADHEQLVHKGDQDDEGHPNDPSPDGAHGHGWVVVRVDDGPDLGVGAVAREQGDFDLDLADGTGVLVGIVKVLAVVDKFF